MRSFKGNQIAISVFNQVGGLLPESVGVLVVEDYEPFRQFISKVLQNGAGMRVVAEAADGLQAVRQAQELHPDLILLDIGLPALNGIETARQILKISPSSKILFVSENHSSEIVQEALSTGACGYVLKSDVATDLLPALKAVLEGKRFVSANLTH